MRIILSTFIIISLSFVFDCAAQILPSSISMASSIMLVLSLNNAYGYRIAFIIIGGYTNLVKNLTMYKIQLENSEFYKSKSGRIQHYRSMERADAKIKKLGDIGTGATVIESKARTARTLNPEENATETKTVKVSKAKKASTKAENPDESVTAPDEFVTDAEAAKETIGKTKKQKRVKKHNR